MVGEEGVFMPENCRKAAFIANISQKDFTKNQVQPTSFDMPG